MLLSERANFDLAQRLRSEGGAPLGEIFSFLSGLYFRGKLAYSRAFARCPPKKGGVWVITAGRGLLAPETVVRANDLLEFVAVPIDLSEPRYAEPLTRDAVRLASELSGHSQAVLLGSIATDKYTSILEAAFGPRLVFPEAFIGRGDMSRGGLMLRAVDERRELTYIALGGATRRGTRPARLPPRMS